MRETPNMQQTLDALNKAKKQEQTQSLKELLANANAYTKTEFKIKRVQFKIDKLSVLDGWELLEDIRFELSKHLGKEVHGNQLFNLVGQLLSIDPTFTKRLRAIFFERIKFKTDSVQGGWVSLDGAEDMAFETLEPIHVHELIVRSLAVNFTSSFKGLLSKYLSDSLSSEQ